MPRNDGATLILNVNVLGFGQRAGAWRASSADRRAFIQPEYWQQIGRLAERGTLDALFLADLPVLSESPEQRVTGNADPTEVLSWVASATEQIGLIATASTTFNNPYELAERYLTLDTLSGGRVAWNVVTTYGSDVAAQNFGVEHIPPRAQRYARAEEFVRIVQGLWQSAATGEPLEFRGEHLAFRGQLRVPPSAQGYPAIVQAGGSPAGRRLAARVADLVFSAEMSRSASLKHYQEVVEPAERLGRRPRILPGLSVVIGSTQEEADRLYDDWERLAPENYALRRLAGLLGEEVLQLPLDQPIPQAILGSDPPAGYQGSLGFRESFVRFARETAAPLREVLRRSGGFAHYFVIGTPELIADTIEDWFLAGAADGFNLMPGVFPQGLEPIVDEVVPILRRRGLFRHEYQSSTLRGRVAETIGEPATV